MNRVLFLVVGQVFASTSSVRAVARDEHPIQKVLNLITNELTDAKRLQEEADITWQKQDRDCTTNHDGLTASIAKHREAEENERTKKEAKQAAVEALAAQITELEASIQANNDQQTEVNATRDKENGEFSTSRDTLQDTVTAVEECITLLKAGSSTLLLQQQGQFLADLYFSPTDARTVRALLQQPADPETRKFDSKLGGVVILFEKLLANMEKKLETRKTEEQNSVNAHGLSIQALEGENTAMTTLLGEKETAKGDAEGARDDAEAEEEHHRSTAEAETTELQDSRRECAATQAEYEKVSNERSEENEAMRVAMEILQQVTGVRAAHVPVASFLQLAPGTTPQERAFALLRTVAQQTHSTALARLAAELKVTKGPFDQVLNMIQKLVDQLKKEQRDDDNHNDWCENEWKVSTDAEEDKTSKRDALVAKTDEADQHRQTNADALAGFEQEVQDQVALKARTNRDRTADKENNQVSIEDAQKAADAITDALDKLNEWKNASEGNQDKGQKVIDLLTETQKHYLTMLSTVKNAEEQAELDHATFLADDAKTVATLKAQIGGAKNKDQRLSSKISTLQQRTATTKESLREVKQYKDDLAKACGKGEYEKDNLYEDRKANRKLEMDGLSQAKEFLANYRAPKSFLQRF